MSGICGVFSCCGELTADSPEKIMVKQFKFIVHNAVCTVCKRDQFRAGDVLMLNASKVVGNDSVFCTVYDPGRDMDIPGTSLSTLLSVPRQTADCD